MLSPDAEIARIREELVTVQEEAMVLASTLIGIANDSPDADIVRAAVAGLQYGNVGRTTLTTERITV